MFTGIIEERGSVVANDRRLEVAATTVTGDSAPGTSIAVNGVCLTVADRRERPGSGAILGFDLSAETVARSCLGALSPGDPVNLERPVTLLTRLGGHLVQGHVDAVGEVTAVEDAGGGGRTVWITLPAALDRYVVEKGSIAVDGVSLTVIGVRDGRFGVALVPFTLDATTLGRTGVRDRVNVEVDVMAKYAERLLDPPPSAQSPERMPRRNR
jgi:riboflavin synthase